jgi:hypothetical protein
LLRAAAIGAGAYYVARRRIEAQERKLEEEARIAELSKLHERGELSDTEFARRIAEIPAG